MKFLDTMLSALKEAKSVAIFTHKDSDHDCICSGLALQKMLQELGIKSVIFVDKTPSEGILRFTNNAKFLTESDDVFDVGITVDCADLNRLCDKSLLVFSKCKKTFNIDHHQDNKFFAQFNYVKGGMSSCCEVLFWLFKGKVKLTKEIAEYLYTGLYMDCGSFNYSSVNSKTHLCASNLMKYCDENINSRFFICFGISQSEVFSITKRAFDSVRMFENGQIAVSILKKSDFEECGCKREDGKFIVSYLQNVKGVKISINISEDKKNEWRVSLRTADKNINVSNIAHRFNGGGHKQASGLTLKGDIEKALKALIYESKKELKKWMDFSTFSKSLA